MQDKFALFQKFLITENAQIDIVDFLINSAIAVILAFLLALTYSKCARSLSNRRVFAQNFILVSFTTMLIISIVKSSLALSLGLVGALSIVRFRSAIKEPEELAYLFLNISIGLGLGANQRMVVLLAFVVISAIIWVRYFLTRYNQEHNLFFTLTDNSGLISLEEIEKILKNNFNISELKRYDQDKEMIEVSYHIEVDNAQQLQKCRNDFSQLSPSVRISYIDNKNF